jgi:hypothetical protein
MRRALFLLLLAGMMQPARAQDQEQKLIDRLERPDMTLQNPAQTKSFYGGKTFNATGNPNVKTFYIKEHASIPQYQTRGFWGSKKNSAADQKFATSAANTTGRYAIPNSDKNFATKKAAVKDSPDAGKTYATNSYSNVHETKVRGTAQGSIDREYGGKKPMTIDEVRELLNKNK